MKTLPLGATRRPEHPRAPYWTVLGLSILAAVALPLLAACSGAAPAVPPALQPAAHQRALTTLAARGVQIYECRAGAEGQAPAWVFVAPDAQLFDDRGRVAGSHGAGPHWTSLDGSTVVGTVRARSDAPTAGAIPWLLLQTRSTAGPGLFAEVTHIQRLRTAGGLAPAGGCQPASIGQRLRVPYTADYRFFVPA